MIEKRRPAIWWGVVVSVLVTMASPAFADERERVAEGIAALPVLGVIEGPSTMVRVRGVLPARRAKDLVALARKVHADVVRRITGRTGDPPKSAKPVDLCLFATSADYDRFVARFD